MCRILSYLGTPVLLEDLLYAPDSALLNQIIHAQMLDMLNLAGFGMAAWDPASHAPDSPFVYRTTQVGVFDRNLKLLASKVAPHAVLAHTDGAFTWGGVRHILLRPLRQEQPVRTETITFSNWTVTCREVAGNE